MLLVGAKNEYYIVYKSFIFKKKVKVNTSNHWGDQDFNPSKKFQSRLSLWGIESYKVLSIHYFLPKALNTFSMNLKICSLLLPDGSKKSVIEILDMLVPEKLRSKSVGSQALNILEQIGKENGYDLIIGELQAGDDLEKRKAFFTKNGFELFHSPQIKFSGWAIMKDLSSNL